MAVQMPVAVCVPTHSHLVFAFVQMAAAFTNTFLPPSHWLRLLIPMVATRPTTTGQQSLIGLLN